MGGISGEVNYGDSELSLIPLTLGQQLPMGSVVEVGAEGVVNVYLAEGSVVHIGSDSLVRISKVHLIEEDERLVELELIRGEIQTHVVSDPVGSFKIHTPLGVADVLGTRFRITVNEEDKKSLAPYSPIQSLEQLGKVPQKNSGDKIVRVETYEGRVRFSNGLSSVDVQSGLFSESRTKKDSVDLGRLPRTPNILSPLKGGFLQTPPLMWASSHRKCSYVVELAQDASFSIGYRRYDTVSTQLQLNDILPGGFWFWRVACVSKGVYSDWSQVYGFELP